MRVVFATAELAPIASVGGLAAAAAGLTVELRRQGVDVEILMPDYFGTELDNERVIEVDVPAWAGPASIRIGDHPACGHLHLVTTRGTARPHPYLQSDGEGWPDNAGRFFAFSRAVASYVARHPPDVLHLNDWHTGATLAALDPAPPTVFSIHNLAYQGRTSGAWLARLGPRATHYEWWGDTNALTGAVALADAIVAVSPHYAGEILTADGGFGVHEQLANRRDALHGILNGIDADVWDPATDPHLPATFDESSLDDKVHSRRALLERAGFDDDGIPLAAVVSRLTHQKGIDLLAPILPLLDQIPMRVAMLGAGDAELADRLRQAAAASPDSVAFVEGYDEALSHLMFAGADLYLMPSRFEPCGLTQMQAMRYGTIPVVTAVGGLVDTVPDADLDPKHGRGFVAARVDPSDLVAAMFRAVRRTSDRRRRRTIQRRGMSVDWSWRGPAAEYVRLYDHLARSG